MITTNFGPKIATALVKAQGEMQSIAKDSVNPHFKSSYLSLDSMIEAVRPILAANGLAVTQGATTPHTNEQGQVTAFIGETMLIHESGEWLLSTLVMPVSKSDAQGAGSSLTYFRRYSLAALLGVASEEDDDVNAASRQRKTTMRVVEKQSKTEAFDGKAKAVADAAEGPITRDSAITFGRMAGRKISDLEDSYLQWGLEEGRNFGTRTKDWQSAFQAELAARDGVSA